MEENNEEIPKVLVVSQEGNSKRLPDTIYLKVLVPSIAAGAIIGKNGEAIGQMQKDTGAKIKLSKLNDFYPGTTERVCLIQGPLLGVKAMHNYIMDRILEKPEISAPTVTPSSHISLASQLPSPGIHLNTNEPSSTAAFGGFTFWPISVAAQPFFTTNRLLWERHKQVKILVPNCTAGLVIGKQGSYVSEIKETTGAFIQISQKSKDINLPERCITIAGEADQLRAAVDMVLTKIAEDPQSGTCPTISYSHAQGPVASAYPTGSPFAYITPQALPQATIAISQPPTAPQTLSATHYPSSSSILRQNNDGGIPSGAYYHNALQATYFAAAAAAAADYQRLVALNTSYSQVHRGIESGEASGASSSLDSVGGGGGGGRIVGPLTPPNDRGLGDSSSPSFYATSSPLLPTSATSQMIANAAAPFVAAAAIYPSSTGGLESPLDPSGFPLLASSPPPSQPKIFAAPQADAFYASPLRTSSPLSETTAMVTTAAWLRSRGYSDEAVAEITHAMSTLSAHGVLNIGGAPTLLPQPSDSILIPLGPLPIAHPHQTPLDHDLPPKKEGAESVEGSTAESTTADA